MTTDNSLTYAEMNAKIVDLLRWDKGNPMLLYAAQRIEELEAEVEQEQRRYDSLRIRFDAAQRVLTRTLEENRVKDECLKRAIEAIKTWYIPLAFGKDLYQAERLIEQIEQRLVELEPEREREHNATTKRLHNDHSG